MSFMPTSHRNGNPTRLLFLVLVIILLLSCAIAALNWSASQRQSNDTGFPWIYLRNGEILAPDENLVELIAVGDVMLGRGVENTPDVFSQVAPQLQSADLTLGNFEGVIPDSSVGLPEGPNDPGYDPYRLLVPEGAVSQLQAAGFDLMSLANNHALDAGLPGLANTVAELQKGGITTLGEDAYTETVPPATIRQVNGVTIAFLTYNLVPLPQGSIENQPLTQGTPTTSSGSWQMGGLAAAVEADIRQARSQADAVVILVHWGREFQLHPDPNQQELAHVMAHAGADVVLGYHPHVAQGIEIRQDESKNGAGRTQLLVYSLGNFVFDQGQEESAQGLALRFFLDKGGLRALQTLPVWAGPRPRWMGPEEASALLERIIPKPPRQGFACLEQGCQPVEVSQEKASGLFWSGQADLSGDGVPEKVRRQEASVTIYQDGHPVWQSPPEWRVVDLALGDPNDDGRAELLLAICKPLPDGGESSHPFIIGYRGGIYRILWGGSAVSDPILEVELGDVNGDGVQELVALEARGANNQRSITVWRWHGWGFSLLWRSQSGPFRNLALIPQRAGGAQTISFSWECWQGLSWICPDYRILANPPAGE